MLKNEVAYRLAKWVLVCIKGDGIIDDSEMQMALKKIAEHDELPSIPIILCPSSPSRRLPSEGFRRCTALQKIFIERYSDYS